MIKEAAMCCAVACVLLVYLACSSADVSLDWNTFLGSEESDKGTCIARDDLGNIYVAGECLSSWGSPIEEHGGIDQYDCFVAKLSSQGELLWNTFLGSTEADDYATSIAIDAEGAVYVVGAAWASWGSPLLPFSGNLDVCVFKLTPQGVLQWNLFLGGGSRDAGSAVAIDRNGDVCIAGYGRGDWGTPINSNAGGEDAFVAKLNSSGALLWNTFMGSGYGDRAGGIAIDSSNSIFVTGHSYREWGEPLRPFQGGLYDAFVAKLSSGGGLLWNTFLGGGGRDSGQCLAVDELGVVYVGGNSDATWGSPILEHSGSGSAFVVQLSSVGSILWNTFLGASEVSCYAYSLALDGVGALCIGGRSDGSWGMPENAYSAGYDGCVAKLSEAGALLWNTFLGSAPYNDGVNAVTVGTGDEILVAGESYGMWGSPIRPFSSRFDAFVASIIDEAAMPEIGVKLLAHTLPGGGNGAVSIGLDWFLGDTPEGGGRPSEHAGIAWEEVPGYGFSLYRDDGSSPVYTVEFRDSGEGVEPWVSKPGKSPREEGFGDYEARWKGDNAGQRATFCGLFDKWTEFEDYGVTDGDPYEYRVSLWYGSPDNEISSSEPVSVTAGDFAWGVIARDATRAPYDLGDPQLWEQLDAVWPLAENGLEYCKFWLRGNTVETLGDFVWAGDSPVETFDWMAGGEPDAGVYEEPVDEYAFPESYESSSLRWGGDPPDQPFAESYDCVIERLNSKGVSPVPWIGHGEDLPIYWPVVYPDDARTMNKYLTWLYVHTRAAARRYRYGLHKIPLWNLENELNWTWLWRSMPVVNSNPKYEWLDYDFVTNVYRALSLAIEHENGKDQRWGRPVTYARSTTNINIHCNELSAEPITQPPGYGAIINAMTLFAEATDIFDLRPWTKQPLHDFVRDWSSYFDIIGLGAYPNYFSPQPQLEALLWAAVSQTKIAAPDKPVMVMEAGYPKGNPVSVPLFEQYTGWQNEYMGWQQDSLRKLAASSYCNGGDGFFYFTLFSDCPTQAPDGERWDEWVEHYWGLLRSSQAAQTEP